MELRVAFADFWPGFNNTDNYFVDILKELFSVEISDHPDVLFFSVFGNEHWKYDCYKIAFYGENVRPNFYETDLAIGFDFPTNSRGFRWPLYNLYRNPSDLPIYNDFREKFCCNVMSNPKGLFRNFFFERLSAREKVDSGGRYRNNVGGPVNNKISFLQNYRFSMAFENSSYPGYTTEKILDSKLAGTIPIYFGNPRIYDDFQRGSFINVLDYATIDSCIDFILEVNSDHDLYERIRQKPLLEKWEAGSFTNTSELKNWLQGALHRKSSNWKSTIFSRINYQLGKAKTDFYDRKVARKLMANI